MPFLLLGTGIVAPGQVITGPDLIKTPSSTEHELTAAAAAAETDRTNSTDAHQRDTPMRLCFTRSCCAVCFAQVPTWLTSS